MRKVILGSVVALVCVVGCSGGSSFTPAPASASDAGVSDGESHSATDSDGEEGGSGGVFDLTLTVTEKQADGALASTLMFIVVRDAYTREVVAISHDEERVVSKTKLAKKGILKQGRRYEIGIKDTWFSNCLDSSANVWYREIPRVDDHVVLDLEVQVDRDEDPKGCGVLHEPVPLPPGTYATKSAVNGVSGNRVALYVSQTGRIYTKELRVFCAAESCNPTTVTHGTCDYEEVVYPGEKTFSLGDASASRTTVKGTATIDEATQTIRYTGRTFTWTGTSTECCDDSFDVTLERVEKAPPPCL